MKTIVKTCTHGDCDRPPHARGLCGAHYKRKLAGQDLDTPLRIYGDDRARFWARVDKSGECWLWMASKNQDGYGCFALGGRTQRSHRVSWEWAHGPIPDGMQLDHMCHNPACVNPAHLRLATNAENSQNLSGVPRNSKSGVRGVSWDKAAGKWRAKAQLNGKDHYLGLYEDKAEAERVVIEWRRERMPYSINDQAGEAA